MSSEALDYGLDIGPGRPPRAEMPKQPRAKVGVDVLWGRHREILRRVSMGMTDTQIAEELDCSTLHVHQIRNSPLGQQQLEHLQRQADSVIQKTQEAMVLRAPAAAAVLSGMMTDEAAPYSVRAKVAMDLLDRVGLGAVKKVEAHNFNQHISSADIEDMKRRLDAAGIIVQVKAEEVEPAPAEEAIIEEIEAQELGLCP